MTRKPIYSVWRPPDSEHEKGFKYYIFDDPDNPIEERIKASFQPLTPKEKPAKSPAPAPETASSRPPAFEPFVCAHCGAIAFIEVKRCQMCRRLFKRVEPVEPKPASEDPEAENKIKAVPPSLILKKPSINFEEFERAKRRLNRARNQLCAIWFEKPAPPERKALEEKIMGLECLIEDNIYLTLIFN